MILKFRNTVKKAALILLLNMAFANGFSEVLSAQKMIDERLIKDYFLFELGTSYKEAENFIEQNKLKNDKKDNIIKIYPASEKINIKYAILIFTGRLLTNIMIYIDEPVTYMEYFYNDLKKSVSIEYTDDSKQTAVWTDDNSTVELKMIKENFSSKKIFCLQYYLNKLKKEPITESSLKKHYKNHFIDISVLGGPVFIPGLGVGGFTGIGFGYQYKFSNYFAFGPGLSGFLTIASSPSHYLPPEDDEPAQTIGGGIGYSGGGAASFCFMFGELDKYNIAFLFDMGGGWMFSVKAGILIKMFTFKIGYYMTAMGSAHHLSFELGIKINFRLREKVY